jgi:FlaA1/EpsC-like NDP-sugar epimerase
MQKQPIKHLILYLFVDILIVFVSIFFSVLIKFDFIIPVTVSSNFNLFNILLFICIKTSFFYLFKLYKVMWRFTSLWDIINIIKANLAGSAIILIIIYKTIRFEELSRSLFLIDFIICTGMIGFSRVGIRVFFSHIKTLLIPQNKQSPKDNSSRNKKNILIIGGGNTGVEIIRQAQANPNMPIKIVGVVDDNKFKIGRSILDVPVISSVDDLLFIKISFDEIYICVPSATKNEMRYIVEQCKKTNKPFKTLPYLSELIERNISISQLREVSLSDLLGREEIALDKNLIRSTIKGKRVLITGAGGSIGSELVRQCIRYDPSILLMFDNSELNLFQIDRELIKNKYPILFKPILGDIKDKQALKRLFDEFRPQVVFHAAAYKHVPMQESFPWEAVKTNVFGTKNLCEVSVQFNVEKFVLVSTDKAVRPTNVMGATKRIAEIIIQNYDIIKNETAFIAVRFGNVLGSSGSVIPIFQEQIKAGGPITITDPEMERYFMSIPEASLLILQAGSLGVSGEIFVLDMGSPIKIIDIANELIRLSGLEPGNDIEIKYTGSRPGEKKVEELILPSEQLDKTKHKKILVINNPDIKRDMFLSIIKEIEFLKTRLSIDSPKDIRVILSKILPEYNPNNSSVEIPFYKLDKENYN